MSSSSSFIRIQMSLDASILTPIITLVLANSCWCFFLTAMSRLSLASMSRLSFSLLAYLFRPPSLVCGYFTSPFFDLSLGAGSIFGKLSFFLGLCFVYYYIVYYYIVYYYNVYYY